MLKIKAIGAVLLACIAAMPVGAQDLSKEQLIALAVERGTCGEGKTPVDAYYKTPKTIGVECSEDATGFVPALGGLGLLGAATGGALALAVVGGGGGGDATAVTTAPSTN